MSDRLLLRLSAHGSLAWLRLGADGLPAGTSARGLPPAPLLAAASRVTVLVPAADVLLLEAPAPTRQRAQLQRAVPYAVEDQLAQAVEDLHFALAPEAQEGRIGVAVLARSALQRWLARLDELGIRADALVPDSLALTPGTVLVEPLQATARLAPWRALSADTPHLAGWLALAQPAGDAPPTVLDTREAPALDLGVPVAAYRERAGDALALLAPGLATGEPLNLLQGEFAPHHRVAPSRRLWRLAAGLSAAALLLAFLFAGAEYALLQRESARLDAAQRAELLRSFPEMEKVAGEPARLMQSALARLGGGAEQGGLLRLLGQIAPVLGSTTRLTTRGLEFRNGALELSVTAPDVPTLDSLRERLSVLPGLKVELTAANPGANGVDGRLRIVGGGA